MYSTQLDESFHLASVRELCRVADEVRIFPLLALGATPSVHVPVVADGCAATASTSRSTRCGTSFSAAAIR
jgi:hypothetical protein